MQIKEYQLILNPLKFAAQTSGGKVVFMVLLFLQHASFSQRQENNLSIQSGPGLYANVRGAEIGFSTMKSLPFVAFTVGKDGLFDLTKYFEYFNANDQNLSAPKLILKQYADHYLICKWRKVRHNTREVQIFYLALMKREEGKILIRKDSNLNYDFNDEGVEYYEFEENFTLHFKDGYSFDFRNPFLIDANDKPIPQKISISPSRNQEKFNTSYTQWLSRNSSKPQLFLNIDLGLGGFGHHAYSFRSGDSEISYEYGFRTAHLALEPAIRYKRFVLGLGIKYEKRQPKEGIREEVIGEERFWDNGYAKFFPTGKEIKYFLFGYDFFAAPKFILQPFVKVGRVKYTGLFSQEFNETQVDGVSYIVGCRGKFQTWYNQHFFLGVSFNYDDFNYMDESRSGVQNDGELRLPFHDSSFHQINISFGYSFQLF